MSNILPEWYTHPARYTEEEWAAAIAQHYHPGHGEKVEFPTRPAMTGDPAVFDPDDKSEKPPMHLCPVSTPEAVATVFGKGAHDRPDYDWLEEPRPYTRYMDSLERHINAFKDGKTSDSKTGLPHLWHAMACLAILVEYEKREVGTNDIHEHTFERQGEPK